MNNYHLEIVAELKQRRDDVERNYASARKEWEREKIKKHNLLDAGEYGKEFDDAVTNCRMLFNFMVRLDEESTSIQECIKAIERAC